MKLSTWLLGCTAAIGIGTCSAASAADNAANSKSIEFGHFKHIVVIYEENHSFDNLYGGWGSAGGEPVNGLSNATADKTVQLRQDNTTAYGCLYQLDVNLTSPPLSATCSDHAGTVAIDSHFGNAPFQIDDYIPSTATTCPAPGQFAANGILDGQGLPGGCTRDIVHRFYSEQYQIDGGKQDRYMTGSDASGLVMGFYDTTKLPIYNYLHAQGAPNYVIADNFFQGAFGGSFLNHQWLVSAAAPVFANAAHDGGSTDLHSVVDANGMPTATPLYTPAGAVKDQMLTIACATPGHAPVAGLACGDYAVNTTQPTYQPFAPGTASYKQLPPLANTTIGDLLTAAGKKWAWYSGGWSNADGDVGKPGWTNGTLAQHSCIDPNALATSVWPNCPDKDFQFHHQAFNYFASFAPGTQQRREHLRDEAEFIARATKGTLPDVSFIKPLGEENEHPGYASESVGSSHLVDLLTAIFNGPDGGNTLVIVTYDEFGGQWDHVPPPGNPGGPDSAHDQWGPGTRIPALIISPRFTHSGVDHKPHDTTSIIATIEHKYGLPALGSRDAAVLDLASAVRIGTRGN